MVRASEQKSEEMRQRILDAAMAQFANGGVEAIAMRALGQRLGKSAMMAYRYFPSKDALLVAMRREVFVRFTEIMQSAVESETEPDAAFISACQSYCGFAEDHPDEYRFLFEMWSFEDQAALVKQVGRAALRHAGSWNILLRCVEDVLKKSGSQADAKLGAHFVWAELHGLVTLHLAHKLAFGRRLKDLVVPASLAMLDLVKRLPPESKIDA